MVDPIDDIARQARQGSVSAVIQILNEKLASSGVRTRAVFEQGILQLLCEAAKPEQLEQSVLVPHVRQILESIQPRRIRRVQINSRIVREQQLLWLDEINRDRGSQLLWSEEIVLRRPNWLKQFFQDLKEPKPLDPKTSLPKKSATRLAQEKRLFWRGLVGGASFSIFVLIVGWALYNWLNRSADMTQADSSNPETVDESADANSPRNGAMTVSPVSSNSLQTADDSAQDPFAQAVRLAQTAVESGQVAETPAEWLALAAQWQQASDLMSQISPDDNRYDTAQSRVELYRQNSEAALEQAERVRQDDPNYSGY